jgi:hypothetical protein
VKDLQIGMKAHAKSILSNRFLVLMFPLDYARNGITDLSDGAAPGQHVSHLYGPKRLVAN